MLTRIANSIAARPRSVLLAAALGFVVAAVLGLPGVASLSSGGFSDPKAESSVAADLLRDRFHAGYPNLVLQVSGAGAVDDPQVSADAGAFVARLTGEAGISQVVSYWTAGRPDALRAKDGRSALVVANIAGDDTQVARTAERLAPEFLGTQGSLEVLGGGRAESLRQGTERTTSDLVRAESVALPITLLLLLLIFRTVAAALIPVVVALVTVVGSLTALVLVNQVTEVSVFAINLATALGLGLGVDYSLLLVTRYREEIAAGRQPIQAMRTTLNTAGRAVAFSGLTVFLSMAVLLIFPVGFLRSFGYAGMATTAIATACALVLLPAIVLALGQRLDKWAIRPQRTDSARDGWGRLAQWVMRRPVLVLVPAVVVLVLAALPLARAEYGLPDDRFLPADMPAAQVGQALRTEFPSNASQDVIVVVPEIDPSGEQLSDFAARLSTVDGVVRSATSVGTFVDGSRIANPMGPQQYADDHGAWVALTTDAEPNSQRGHDLVAAVRALPPPDGAEALVTGETAIYRDTLASMWPGLPIALLLIALFTFALLFLFTGSVVLPVKAILLNLLSVGATLGAMTWIFQYGHLQWLIGDFGVTGFIVVAMPVIMFCIIFGLSMDYEMFLLSRIKESYDRSGDNAAAVVDGLGSTGRLITAAAVLLSLFFGALATTGVSHVKMLGLGTAVAILLDAFVIRGILVPAVMQLLGRAGWWAPTWLRRLHPMIGNAERVEQS